MKKIIVLGLMVMLMAMGTGCGSISAAPEDDYQNSSYCETDWENEDDADVTNEYNYETNNYSYEENYSYEYNDDYDYEENYSYDVTYDCDYEYDCDDDYEEEMIHDEYGKWYCFSDLTDQEIYDSIYLMAQLADNPKDEMISKTEAEFDFSSGNRDHYQFCSTNFFGCLGDITVETVNDEVDYISWVFTSGELTDETIAECDYMYSHFMEVCENQLPLETSYEIDEDCESIAYICELDDAQVSISKSYFDDHAEIYIAYAEY